MSSTVNIQNSWVEKYRPKILDDMIINDDIRKFFTIVKKNGSVKNILLSGHAGIGKSSLAKIIPNDLIGCQYIYINASDESGIDTIRNKVTGFVQTMSFDGKLKIVILDEADGLTQSSQHALRNLMEQYNDTSSFILTANYGHKIIEPLKSRCQSFNISFTDTQYIKHILGILKKENVKVNGNIISSIKSYYPDFRKCLHELQKQYTIGGGIIGVDGITSEDKGFVKVVWDAIGNEQINELRRLIITNEDLFENDYHKLSVQLFNYVCNLDISEADKSMTLIKLGESIRNHPTVLDGEINLISKLIEIKTALTAC